MYSSHRMKLFFGVCITLFFCGMRPFAQEEGTVHLLTWSGYTGAPDGGSVEDVAFSLNGKSIGDLVAATRYTRSYEHWKDTVVRIVFPGNAALDAASYDPPYVESGILPFLVSSGARLEFYHLGKKCDYRTHWWDLKAGDDGDWAKVEFFLDGTSLGMGLDAQKKLAQVKWGYRPTLVILLFSGRKYPYRTTTCWLAAVCPRAWT